MYSASVLLAGIFGTACGAAFGPLSHAGCPESLPEGSSGRKTKKVKVLI